MRLLLPFIFASVAHAGNFCTDGFSLVNNKCLKLFNTPVSHMAAEATCVALGATLVTAKNAIDNRGIVTVATGVDHVWMGLYCTGDDASTCQWDDFSGSAQSYNNFARSFPYSEIGKCVYFSVTGSLSGQWVSAECEKQLSSFVCELPTTSYDTCRFNYNGFCYLPSDILNGNDLFITAQQTCHQYGANLASVHSQNEILYIQRMYQSFNSTSIYIGCSRNAWLDGTPFDFNNADPSSTTSGDCLSMSLDGYNHPRGTWYNSNCGVYQPYLCKRPAGVQPTASPPPVIVTPAPGNATPCNNSILLAPGTLTSPNFPSNYGNSMSCGYTLFTAGPSKISITFLVFVTEAGYDKVTLYDGDSDQSPLITSPISGTKSNAFSYSSTGNVMFVKFQSDQSNTMKGFSANFVSAV